MSKDENPAPSQRMRGILADLLKLVEAMPRTDRGFSWEARDWQGNEAIRAYGENAKLLKFILDNTDQIAAELRAALASKAKAIAAVSQSTETNTPALYQCEMEDGTIEHFAGCFGEVLESNGKKVVSRTAFYLHPPSPQAKERP